MSWYSHLPAQWHPGHRLSTHSRCHCGIIHNVFLVVSQLTLSLTKSATVLSKLCSYPGPVIFKRSAHLLSGSARLTPNFILVCSYWLRCLLLTVSRLLHLRLQWHLDYNFNTLLRCHCHLTYTSVPYLRNHAASQPNQPDWPLNSISAECLLLGKRLAHSLSCCVQFTPDLQRFGHQSVFWSLRTLPRSGQLREFCPPVTPKCTIHLFLLEISTPFHSRCS